VAVFWFFISYDVLGNSLISSSVVPCIIVFVVIFQAFGY